MRSNSAEIDRNSESNVEKNPKLSHFTFGEGKSKPDFSILRSKGNNDSPFEKAHVACAGEFGFRYLHHYRITYLCHDIGQFRV